ncbi:LysR family transcriptional regulator [Limosilactobacillus sp. RRLNB_1_1]|uniref:LysR family transcriptional regulator n=1 Tax=Limosilactobacillus albertensis TaxID=2759752 RepID=A0A7W3TSK2_9LACO|nr:LysR family transcriptional regulator [Limosilactobacillus albertensis]MBB1070117.1 LysR family transcriptional regulator [Limosilactobacillus albertensis]MCD7117736.1 LysR family transcriptional regulator [Limosilactobacillus albertensis]MCD7128283.1 LysR family transcriptional regulator [Limosilactobacillus albertensis]
MSTLDFKQINAFVNLGNTLNYQLTAKKLGLTVDEVKAEIESLEKELAVKLIQSQNDKFELTELGTSILSVASKITENQAKLATLIADYKEKEKQQAIKLAVVPAFDNYDAASAIQGLAEHYKLTITEDDDPVTQLEKGQSDIAFISYADKLPDDFELISVGEDRLVAYVPARNPLSKKTTLALTDLKAEKFLTLNHQKPFAAFVQQVCSDAGLYLYSVFEGERGKTLVNMVALGMGVTLLMEQSISRNLDSKVVKIPIVPEITQHLAFARRKNIEHTPIQEKLWHDLKELFEK